MFSLFFLYIWQGADMNLTVFCWTAATASSCFSHSPCQNTFLSSFFSLKKGGGLGQRSSPESYFDTNWVGITRWNSFIILKWGRKCWEINKQKNPANICCLNQNGFGFYYCCLISISLKLNCKVLLETETYLN